MSEVIFTKGPWTRDDNDGYSINRIFADTRGHHAIAEVIGDDAETEANAHLIAAAPDLYAALLVAELASEELCQGQDPANECWVTLATIRAALAKARGEA